MNVRTNPFRAEVEELGALLGHGAGTRSGAESNGPRMHRSAALHFHNEAKPCRVWRGPETFAVLLSFA